MKIVGKVFKLLARIFLYLWCAFSIFSLLWIGLSSLKTNREFFANIWGIFESPQWENYVTVWTTQKLGLNFLNSLIVVGISTLGILVICTPAAYVLSRCNFRLKKFVSTVIILGMGIPYQLMLVPLYSMLLDLGLNNTLAGLILVYIAVSIPFTVFLERGFFRSLPSSLGEAALVDGCGPFGTFFRVMLPLAKGGIVTAAIFNFVSLWNEFLLCLTIITDDALYTLPVGLYQMQTAMSYVGNWTALFAGVVIVVIPTLVVYILLSRQIVEGLTMGAVKE